MTTYGDKLRDPRWQRKRLEILSRDDFTCRLCGDNESTLHVHHLLYFKGAEPWQYDANCLVTTCESCHEELHVARYGERIVQALIAGRAGMNEIARFTEHLQMAFNDGPEECRARFSADQWDKFFDALAELIHEVKVK